MEIDSPRVNLGLDPWSPPPPPGGLGDGVGKVQLLGLSTGAVCLSINSAMGTGID